MQPSWSAFVIDSSNDNHTTKSLLIVDQNMATTMIKWRVDLMEIKEQKQNMWLRRI